jgi:hypothetical protein
MTTMFPSSATLALGLVITAVLAVVDWYVWSTVPVLPYPLVAAGRVNAGDDENAAFKEVA